MERTDADTPPDLCKQSDASNVLARSQSLPANLAVQWSQLGGATLPVACAKGPTGFHSSPPAAVGMKTQVLSVLG